jgi:hypothetical protein
VVVRIPQRGHRDYRRKSGPVLANLGQLVDVLDAARRLEHEGVKARRDRYAELVSQRGGALDHFVVVVKRSRRDPIDHVRCLVAQHALGARVEDLDDPHRVGGDTREIRTVEDRVLQRGGPDLGFSRLAVAPAMAMARARGRLIDSGHGSECPVLTLAAVEEWCPAG